MLLSIILPCYNEEKQIENTIIEIKKFLSKYNFDYEIVPVNDGSKDNTAEIIKKVALSDNIVNPVIYNENHGKGYAVKMGIQKAIGDYILFMDTDLSTDLSAIDIFLKQIKDYDIVIGSRRHKDSVIPKPQGPLRKFIGNCCVVITKAITGLNLNDTQCGFKGFKKDIAKKIISKQLIENWAFDVEYLYIANINGYTIKDIPVTWINDEDSKVSPISSSIKFFKDLFRIVGNKKQYRL